jgi:hypothetical protein
VFKRGYLGQFIPDRLKKTFNVLMVVSTDVGSDEDREGMHLKGSSELIDFLQRRAFQASFQRAEIRTAAHCRKILLREVFTGSNLFERLAEGDVEFQFSVPTKGTMKRYRAL